MTKQSEVLQFSLAYRYANPQWSDEKNLQVYGHDASANGLGGNFVITVTAEASHGEWDRAILAPLKAHFDHKCLYSDLPRFHESSSTLENITLYMSERLAEIPLPEGRWLELQVQESADLAAMWDFAAQRLVLKTRELFPMQWQSGPRWGGGQWEAWISLHGQVDPATGLMYSRQELKNLVASICQSQSRQVHSIEGDITPLVNKVSLGFTGLKGFQALEISINRGQTFRLYL